MPSCWLLGSTTDDGDEYRPGAISLLSKVDVGKASLTEWLDWNIHQRWLETIFHAG